ncbi:MAG: hypothetical protein HY580_06110 [Nitrospinae bacterium]|nr:hypothetical protein [Nitrospinota bacterium]
MMACQAGKTAVPAAPYDAKADVEFFLQAKTASQEAEALDRLQLNKASNEDVKALLREMHKGATAGPAGPQTGLTIEHNKKPYPYALFVPEPLEKDRSYPLIVVLHGAGGSGEATLPAWVKRLRGEFIIACPTYPMGAWWTLTAEKIVLDLIEKLQAEYPVDPNRVFLAGLSNGAIGAYMIGMFSPDRFAGIVPIAGAVTERYMHFLVNLNNTPVYMIQGQKDPIFPIHFSRRIHQILSDMKYPVVYREHEETGMAHGGHFLPELEVPALYDWLLAQRRKSNPTVIRMTREGNHLARIHWARLTKGRQLAALQVPGPEDEPVLNRDGKIATLFASYKGRNEFEILGNNLLEYEIYLNSEMVDFGAPIRVSTQKILIGDNGVVPGEMQASFNEKVDKDLGVLLGGYKSRRDPYQLYDAKIKISLEKEIEVAFNR